MKYPALFSLVILILSIGTAYPQEEQIIRTFESSGRTYQIAFIERPNPQDFVWPVDLIMRWRKSPSGKWHTESRIDGVRLEKEVKLKGKSGELDALVVSRPGGSAQFVSVIAMQQNPPVLKMLLEDELDKGDVIYWYDSRGRLIGLKFRYSAWHVAPEGFDLMGHVFTARNLAWLPDQQRFRRGPVYVDTQSEDEADLASVLLTPGSDVYLPIEHVQDDDYEQATVIFEPKGILKRKTPFELRTARKVKVVIRFGPEPEYESKIVELSRVDDK